MSLGVVCMDGGTDQGRQHQTLRATQSGPGEQIPGEVRPRIGDVHVLGPEHHHLRHHRAPGGGGGRGAAGADTRAGTGRGPGAGALQGGGRSGVVGRRTPILRGRAGEVVPAVVGVAADGGAAGAGEGLVGAGVGQLDAQPRATSETRRAGFCSHCRLNTEDRGDWC